MIREKNNRYLQFKDLVRSYVDLQNRLKTLGEKTDYE